MADDKRTPSRAELDLQARLDPDHVPDSNILGAAVVNPNPLGESSFVGTDPIYQSRANKTEQPKASASGPEKLAETDFKDQFDLSEVDDERVVVDNGLGGKAAKAGSTTLDVPDVLLGGSADVTHKSDPAPSESESGVVDGGETSGDPEGTGTPASPLPPAPGDNTK